MFWILQLPNALGFLGMWYAGKRRRAGWGLALLSEVAWAGWGYASHNPGIYPWCIIWGLVYSRNWWLWKRGEHAVPTRPNASGPSDLG